MRAGLLKLAGAATLAMTLAGCVSLGGGKPPPFLLTLSAEKQVAAGAAAAGSSASAIMVMEPETDQRLSVNRVPVQVDDAKVAYIAGTAWVERPSRLFRALLAETIRFRTGGLVIEDSQPSAPVGTRLGGQLLDLGYDARKRAIVVRYDAIARSASGEVRTKRFQSEVRGVEPKAKQIGPALNAAANDVARQVAEWIAGS